MIVFIDRQHAGKPNNTRDLGASRDLDGDGQITAAEAEAIWTARIGIELEILLRDHGIEVMPISDGSYSARHARVNSYMESHPGPAVYLAMHLNAGGGNYGAMFYDHRSTQGPSLAAAICAELGTALDIQTKSIAASPDDWTSNAFYTIRNVKRPVAICCEPIFIDTHSQFLSIKGISKIAQAMAQGIIKWNT